MATLAATTPLLLLLHPHAMTRVHTALLGQETITAITGTSSAATSEPLIFGPPARGHVDAVPAAIAGPSR